MKLNMVCKECWDEIKAQGGNLDDNYSFQRIFLSTDFNDSGLYEFKCRKGHTIYTKLQNFKFEILFDMGVQAFYDDYYRESVSSFAAALERFFEMSINLFCIINDIDNLEYENTWSIVSNQSERQLGAYYFLYLITYKKALPPINNKMITFRNKVIHKGYIPTREETLEYAKYVYEYISSKIIEYKIKYEKQILNLTLENLKKIKSNNNTSVLCTPTSLSFTTEIKPFERIFNI